MDYTHILYIRSSPHTIYIQEEQVKRTHEGQVKRNKNQHLIIKQVVQYFNQ